MQHSLCEFVTAFLHKSAMPKSSLFGHDAFCVSSRNPHLQHTLHIPLRASYQTTSLELGIWSRTVVHHQNA